MIGLIDDEIGLEIHSIEIRLIIGMSSLKKLSLNLYYNKVTEKDSTVDNNGIRSTSLGISGLGQINSNLRCKGCLLY